MIQIKQFLIGVLIMSVADINQTKAAVEPETGYSRKFVSLIELVYGGGYLSQGGREEVKALLDGVQMQGKRVLDVGCGLGGPVLDLALEFNIDILGVDPEGWMVLEAKQRLESVKPQLRGTVAFAIMPDPLSFSQFAEAEFDLILSKEVILHVPVEAKLAYFQELHRILKPGGQLIIKDWFADQSLSESTRKMMDDDGVPFNLIKLELYQDLLTQAGFSQIQISDGTEQYIKYCEQNEATVQAKKDEIIQKFGEKDFEYMQAAWGPQKQAFMNREIRVIKVVAKCS